MAKVVLGNAKVVLGGTDLTNFIAECTINLEKELLETTGFGDTYRTRVTSFLDWNASFRFFDDLADNSINELLYTWVTATTVTSMAVLAIRGSAISASNPEYQGNFWVESAPLLSAAVGTVAGGTLNVRGDGALVRDITP